MAGVANPIVTSFTAWPVCMRLLLLSAAAKIVIVVSVKPVSQTSATSGRLVI